MALKGKSVIELYNSRTRVKERYVNENIVTNALNWLFEQNINGSIGSLVGGLVPLYKNAIGGVILFDNEIEENVNTVVAPNTIGCTAYASTDTYAGTDLSRGSMNLTETALLDNGMKLVWDFATHQGNGDIACLSLTSAAGGKIGYGSPYSKESCTSEVAYATSTKLTDLATAKGSLYRIGDYGYEVRGTASNTLSIKKYKFPKQTISLLYSYIEPVLLETKEITTTLKVDTKYYSYNSSYGNAFNTTSFYYAGYLWTYYRTSTSNVNLIRVDLTDYSIKEYQLTSSALFTVESYTDQFMTIRGEYIYVKLSNSQIAKYTLADSPVYVNTIDLLETKNRFMHMYNSGNYIIVGENIIDGNDNVRIIQSLGTPNYTSYYTGNQYIDEHGLIMYRQYSAMSTYASSRVTREEYCYRSNYLATINNLDTAVTKTADKTMKITYTLTEE